MITMKTLRIRLVMLTMFGVPAVALAHDNHTIHPTLTDKSYDAWVQKVGGEFFDEIGIGEGDTFSFPTLPGDADSLSATIYIGRAKWSLSQPATLKDWLIAGSVDEDAPDTRCLAHFYNPLGTHNYLTDPIPVSLRDSFEWASAGTYFTPLMGAKPSPGTNQESWVKARDYYYDALTKLAKSDREGNLARTFYALGKVSHLLQDLSEPEHVRNDAHMVNGSETPIIGDLGGITPNARWIENYGRDKISKIIEWPELSDVTALDWRSAGFKKMEDFWNRHVYTGNGTDLDADASGSKLLGLSEFVNGNFLGADASYESSKAEHWFPHPSIADTNISSYGFHDVFKAFTWEDGAVNPASGRFRQSFCLKKERSGVIVDKHSLLIYSQLYSGRIFGIEASPLFPRTTINAPDVLANYHKIVLPKAIEYTAGLLDYFFRGKLEVEVTWDNTNKLYKLAITNNSSQPFKGGTFTLYTDTDDAAANRSEVNLDVDDGSWDDSRTLQPGATVNATCHQLSDGSKEHMLVYQGIIGLNGNAEADTIEAGHAIAAYHFSGPMPSCPEPERVCESITKEVCGYALPIIGVMKPKDLCLRFGKRTFSRDLVSHLTTTGGAGTSTGPYHQVIDETFSGKNIFTKKLDADGECVESQKATATDYMHEVVTLDADGRKYPESIFDGSSAISTPDWHCTGSGTYTLLYEEVDPTPDYTATYPWFPNGFYEDETPDATWTRSGSTYTLVTTTTPSGWEGTEVTTKKALYETVAKPETGFDFDTDVNGTACSSSLHCNTITKARFKWIVPEAYKGTYFKVTWDVYIFPSDPDQEPILVEKDRTWEWEDPADRESEWFEIEPPSVDGDARVVNVRSDCYRTTK